LKQTVQSGAGQSLVVNLHVTQLPVAGQAVATTIVGTTAPSAALQPDGQLAIHQQVSVVPAQQPVDGAPPASISAPTFVDVDMTLAPNGQSITSEQVQVQDVPTSLPTTNVVGTPSSAAPTSSVAPAAGGVGAVAPGDVAEGVVGDFSVMGRPIDSSVV